MNYLKVLLMLIYAVHLEASTNYCEMSLCGISKHVACGHTGRFAPTCSKDAKMIDIDASTRQLLIHTHNKIRNRIAGGKKYKFKPACRMAKIHWDDELASLANLNVKQCNMKHDACRKTMKFQRSGQNLFYKSFYEPLNITKALKRGMKMWYKEMIHTSMHHINSYPKNYNGPDIGHFTQMVADRNTHLGCGASTYSISGAPYKILLVACNYATTNIINASTYKSCPSAASKCTKGTDSTYKNLCISSEPIDPNE